jgi:antitoxin VapB
MLTVYTHKETAMSVSTSSKGASKGIRTTTVFTSGNSQAVRLPKEFRLESKTVEIFWRNDEIVLRTKNATVGDLLRSLPKLSAKDLAAWDAMDLLIQDTAPQERDGDALLGDDDKKKASDRAKQCSCWIPIS